MGSVSYQLPAEAIRSCPYNEIFSFVYIAGPSRLRSIAILLYKKHAQIVILNGAQPLALSAVEEEVKNLIPVEKQRFFAIAQNDIHKVFDRAGHSKKINS